MMAQRALPNPYADYDKSLATGYFDTAGRVSGAGVRQPGRERALPGPSWAAGAQPGPEVPEGFQRGPARFKTTRCPSYAPSR